jgi:hypothetical protein
MIFENPYFTPKEKINLLQRWIIVQSLLYYHSHLTLVSDEKYDSNCRQLLELKKKYKSSFKKSRYYNCFYDFDGTTGYHLYKRLKYEDKAAIDRDFDILISRFG